MSRYNLIDKKWIPVRYPDGTRDELGIRDTLLRSKEIAEIEDGSPLVVAALHRFLLALLYRALEGPNDIEQAKTLFREGLPSDKIIAYLEKWRDRFWLFDERYPFGQNPNVPPHKFEPWTKLTAEYNATTNKVLFDHTDTTNPGTRSPAECSRWLLSTMSFSIAGGRGYYPSPSPNAMVCIPCGRNLHATLCYNLVPYPNRDVSKVDSAIWERDPVSIPLTKPKRSATGYSDLFTWPSRMILLDASSHDEIAGMRFIAGEGFENPSAVPDPMQPYKMDKKMGMLPVRFRKDRRTWRDFDALLPDSSDIAPLTIRHSIRLAGKTVTDMPIAILVVGLRYEPPSANVDFWRMERFVLPEALAGDRFTRLEIKTLLTAADDADRGLRSACYFFARNALTQGERKPDHRDINGFVTQMPVSSCFWSIMESRFHEILEKFTIDYDSQEIRREWFSHVRDAFQRAWAKHSAQVSTGDARSIRALVLAEGPIRKTRKSLDDMIKALRPLKEGT